MKAIQVNFAALIVDAAHTVKDSHLSAYVVCFTDFVAAEFIESNDSLRT